jgi:adenine C2-methylase RlmN of 23S rRNA A2503 and tRNA A37
MDNIFNYTLNELEDKLVSLGLKKFIASQIYD